MIPLLVAAAAADEVVWVRVEDADDADRARRAGLTFGESQDGAWTLFYGSAAQADAAGLPWRVAAAGAGNGYAPTPDAVEAALLALEADGAGEVVDIGTTATGARIVGLRMGDGTRALRVFGAHHGDEGSSVVVALALAEALAEGGLPDDTEVWIVPAVNPDGLAAGSRWNAAGVDLNRNYGEQWSDHETRGGAGPFSEPETRAVRALARARAFVGGLSLHSGASNFGWVWNWTTAERPPEEALFLAMGEDYRDACAAPGFWITNGADWYVTNGDTTDWTYGAWGAHDFTVELTEEKSPPREEVDAYVAWHLDALLAWVGRPTDVSAAAFDAESGEPVVARVEGDDAAPAWTGPDGRLARWSLDPEAPLEVSAPGYLPTTLAASTPLVRATLLDTLPSPRLLSRGAGARTVTLAGASAGPLTLSAPGEADVVIAADGAGAWTIDPAALAPGAWTLTTAEGVVPRGLFVGEVDDRARIDAARVEDGVLHLEGVGFGRGAEAWALSGTARGMRPLPRVDGDATSLAFALDEDADVLVWTAGAWLAVVDARAQEPVVDETPPPADYVEATDTDPLDPRVTAPGACGTPAAPTLGGALLAVVALLRRRPTAGRDASGLPSARG